MLLVGNLVGPEFSCMSVEWTVIVGFTKQRLDREEDGANLVESRPLLLENVQADVAVIVYVGMEAGGGELDAGGLVGVACWELQLQLVLETFVDRVLGTLHSSNPREEIVSIRES